MEKQQASNGELAWGIGLAAAFFLLAAGVSVEPILI